ncbi:arylesterase [Chthonobacter albigriseus]|uniref:arylesterase n=1 Tax=Chthonobacter albigriseus TaxID=1683161 RepID=UPI0015EFA0BA|nr:arylesterase [Chthonobacter albigriseus]
MPVRFVTRLRKGFLGGLVALLVSGLGPSPAAAEPVTILAFGDSLTAGLGLPGSSAFPAKLEAALKAKGHDVKLVNAGVSGDTAGGGLARLNWSLTPEIDGVIVELGANDALRGLDPAETRKALDAILKQLKDKQLPVLLAGMLAPPNMGAAYGEAFNRIYPELAATHGAILYPFFLDGVVADRALNQQDGIHPTAEGVDIIVARILPAVESLIDRIEKSD